MVSVDGELQVHNFAFELERLERICGHHGQERKRNKLEVEDVLALKSFRSH